MCDAPDAVQPARCPGGCLLDVAGEGEAFVYLDAKNGDG